MADLILTKQTSLPAEEVIPKAIQFFSTEKWRTTSQSPRAVTFEGQPPIPWFFMFLTVLGYCCCIVPGIVMKIKLINKMRRFQNLVVTLKTVPAGTEITVTYPNHSKHLVERFFKALPE